MAKVQPTTVKISYNGPFTNYQTAPLFFSQTVRNIALTRPSTISKRIPAADKASALNKAGAEDSIN